MRNSRIVRANMPAQNTRLPLIGKIRCGEKRTNSAGKEYPASLDYFIATGAYASKFDEVYVKPERIPIVFISDDDFQSCYEEWDGRDNEGRRAGYGDGETYWLWEYGKNEYTETKDRQRVAEFSKKHAVKWRQVLTINFVIPAIKGVFGVWQLQTGGDKSSINAIRNTFDEMRELAGTVINIPFDLCVKRVTSNKPEAKSVYPVISLVPNISAENMETLRAFFEAGLDIKRQGVLTDQKLTALQQHNVTEIEAVYDEAKERLGPALEQLAGTPVFNKTALDAAAATVADKQAQPPQPTDHALRVGRQIKQCKTVAECKELYSTEPLLFMEDENTPLGTMYTDRLNELQNGG